MFQQQQDNRYPIKEANNQSWVNNIPLQEKEKKKQQITWSLLIQNICIAFN